MPRSKSTACRRVPLRHCSESGAKTQPLNFIRSLDDREQVFTNRQYPASAEEIPPESGLLSPAHAGSSAAAVQLAGKISEKRRASNGPLGETQNHMVNPTVEEIPLQTLIKRGGPFGGARYCTAFKAGHPRAGECLTGDELSPYLTQGYPVMCNFCGKANDDKEDSIIIECEEFSRCGSLIHLGECYSMYLSSFCVCLSVTTHKDSSNLQPFRRVHSSGATANWTKWCTGRAMVLHTWLRHCALQETITKGANCQKR